MIERDQELGDTGLEVLDAATDADFQARKLHARDAIVQLQAVRRLARAFVDNPDNILHELVTVAVDLCGADSSAVSIIREEPTDQHYYEWIASTGVYAGFLNAMLPKYPSACGLCLERGKPQVFKVYPRFFDILGVEAPPVTDGLLIPWHVEDTHGTIFILAHERKEAFDADDCRMMEMLADFAAMGMRQLKQRDRLLRQANAAAVATMANELAHEINNPLQSLTNLLFLAATNRKSEDERKLASTLQDDVARIDAASRRLLSLPKLRLDSID